jgi:hypothetical protein
MELKSEETNVRVEGVLSDFSKLRLKEVVRVGINLRQPSWEVTTEPTPSGRLQYVSSKNERGRGCNRICIGALGLSLDVALDYACVLGKFSRHVSVCGDSSHIFG